MQGYSASPGRKHGGFPGSPGQWPINSSSAGKGGSYSSSSGGRKGVVGFGGRNDGAVVLKQVRDVLNRIRWDLVEVCGRSFDEVKVYIEDDVEIDKASRLCRTWLREEKCSYGRHCKYSHDLTLANLRTRPSPKSGGAMGPLRVLEEFSLEAALSSSSIASSYNLHRAMFVEYGSEIVWDKEVAEVWGDYLRAATGEGGDPPTTNGASANNQPHVSSSLSVVEEPAQGRSTSSVASTITEASLDPADSDLLDRCDGNRVFADLPVDVLHDLFKLLEPQEAARCMLTCRGWYERASEPSVWSFFLHRHFGLEAAASDPRHVTSYGRLTVVTRNARRLSDDARATSTSSSSPSMSALGMVLSGAGGNALRKFHGHEKTVVAVHVDEESDRLVSVGVGGSVRIYELQSGTRLGTVDLRTHVTCMAVGPRSIYCGSLRGSLHTVERDDLASVDVTRLGASSVSSLCLVPCSAAQHHSRRSSFGSTHSRGSYSSPSPPATTAIDSSYEGALLLVGLGNGSFLLLDRNTPLHRYLLPVSHPACVYFAPLGPRSFVACATPDQIFLWSAADAGGGACDDDDADSTLICGNVDEDELMGMVSLRPSAVAYSSSMREDGVETRHVVDECCDVVVAASLDGSIVVTACNHDLALRWWAVGDSGCIGCVAITAAYDVDVLEGDGGGDAKVQLGTLALACADGVVVSAHMDGSLVVWHAAVRAQAARLQALPLLECVALTSCMGMLLCYERHIIYCSSNHDRHPNVVGLGDDDADTYATISSSSTRSRKDKPNAAKCGAPKPRRRGSSSRIFNIKGAHNLFHY